MLGKGLCEFSQAGFGDFAGFVKGFVGDGFPLLDGVQDGVDFSGGFGFADLVNSTHGVCLVCCLVCCLTFCKEVFIWLWGDNPRPSFEVVFFEEVRRVARGEFDFFKLGLCERDEARFAVVHCGSSVVGLLRSSVDFCWNFFLQVWLLSTLLLRGRNAR